MTAQPRFHHDPEWSKIPVKESRSFVDVWVTPDMAEKWLQTNYDNRPLISSVIEHYARLIRKGSWKLNGETIKFDTDLRVLDGQHRLYGCIEADGSFLTDIRCGLERSCFDTIDSGRKRSSSDVLYLAGERSTHVLASALGWVWRIQSKAVQNTSRPASTELRTLLENNSGIRESVQIVQPLRTLTSVSLAAALHYLFSQSDPVKVQEFTERLIDGVGLSDDSPIYLLRERLRSNRSAKAHISTVEVAALIIKAWNFFKEDRKTRMLRWRTEEDFPQIK